MHRPLALAAAAALLLGSFPGGVVQAAIQTDGVVAFREACSGRLYAMNPDGTGRHLLPDVGGGRVLDVSRAVGPATVLASAPVPLPGGGSRPTLDAIDAAGTQAPVALLDATEPTPGGWAAFSPRGDLLAYVSFSWDPVAGVGHADLEIGDVVRDASGAIIDVANVTSAVDLLTLGSPADSIASAPYVFTGPLDFAPDGRRLVVTIYDDLWELTLDTDLHSLFAARPITRTTSLAERMPSWSPTTDAGVVAFSGGPYSTSGGGPLALYMSDMNIYTADVATGITRQVTTPKNKGASSDGKTDPSWSRNGTYLLYTAFGPAAFGKRGQSSCSAVNFDLFQIPADGSLKAINVTNTTGTGVEIDPAWGW